MTTPTTSDFLSSLVEHGVIHDTDAQQLHERYGDRPFAIGVALYSELPVAEDRDLLGHVYGTHIGKAHVPLARSLFQPEALQALVPEMARRLHCMPIYLFGDVLTVAMPHPEDAAAVSALSKLVGRPVSAVFAFPQEIDNSIEIHYRDAEELQALGNEAAGSVARGTITPEQLQEFAASAGVVHLVRGLLLYCVKNHASDIHIQPTARNLAVRFRIDGSLQTVLTLGRRMAQPVLARLKVLAGIDVVERRHPQDGRVSLEMQERSYDFRLSTLPTAFGEKAVLRAIGSSDELVKPLEQLGLSSRNRRLLHQLTDLANGMIYVTGPTGSGKTTTLYSLLSRLNRPEVNIVTIEDPVELRIDGLAQVQVNHAIDLDFAKALRAVLRQDPQVVLIGEVRDLETARIASQAALTGHLVMATLHTNNAAQAVARLVDIGLDPALLAPALTGVVAQRLVRRICAECKESYTPSRETLEALFVDADYASVKFWRGRGCETCRDSGYAGRIALHEVLVVSDAVRVLVASRAPASQIQREALRQGFSPMRYDGLMKVIQGYTTLDEVNRVTAVVKSQR